MSEGSFRVLIGVYPHCPGRDNLIPTLKLQVYRFSAHTNKTMSGAHYATDTARSERKTDTVISSDVDRAFWNVHPAEYISW
jgi:hypothetical protein